MFNIYTLYKYVIKTLNLLASPKNVVGDYKSVKTRSKTMKNTKDAAISDLIALTNFKFVLSFTFKLECITFQRN